MEVGTSQRVVEYSVVQKITEPVTDHYFHNPQHKTYGNYYYSNNKNDIKEKCPSGLNER